MQEETQEVAAATAGLNGSEALHAVIARDVAPAAAAGIGAGNAGPAPGGRALLLQLMDDPIRRADIHRRVTETTQSLRSMAKELGIKPGTFNDWVKEQGWPRPFGAPKSFMRRRRGSVHGDEIGAARAKLIGAVSRQIDLVERRLKGRNAEVEEKDSRILGNLAKTLGTLMQMGGGGTTSNDAEPPDRADVEERLAERIKRWARGEQGY